MSKKVLIISIIIIALVLGFTIYRLITKPPPKYTGPVEKITLAGYAGETAALVYVAEDQGFFEKNGLEVTIKDYPSGKAAADAIIDGEADIATSADFVFVINSFDHADLRIFGTVATAEVIELVARKDKGITTPADLNGKKLELQERAVPSLILENFCYIMTSPSMT